MIPNELQNTNRTVYQLLKAYAALYQDKTAIEYKTESGIEQISYRQFFEDCCRTANFFRREVLGNSAIAITGGTSYINCVAFIAAMFDGNVSFPLNPELEQQTLAEVLKRRKTAFLIYDSSYPSASFTAARISCNSISAEEFGECMRAESPLFEENRDIRPENTCLNLLTSGTTGIPKIVMCSHYLFAHHASDYPGNRLLLLFPLHHLGGVFLLGMILGRGDTVCLSSFAEAVRDIKLYQTDMLFTVPALLKILVRLDKAGMTDLSCMKIIGTAAAAPCMEAFGYVRGRGIETANLYGSTECGGELSSYDPFGAPPDSVGRTSPYFETDITEDGELLLRGRTLMNGYFEDEKSTGEVLKNGWYHTGDAAFRDENGYLFISGRIRNLIVLSNGENVSPEAIESELSRCGSIEMCMIRQKDDRIIAEVYCGRNNLKEKEKNVRDFIEAYNKKAASFHRIGRVEFRDTPFDTTSNGKLIRKETG